MNSQSEKHLYCGNFPELQERFVADVIRQRRADPLAPLDVVVSGQMQRLYVKRELARQGCSHAGVRFLTLAELAADYARPVMEAGGLRVLPDTMRRALVGAAIREAGTLSYFRGLSGLSGFRTAVWTTIQELRHAALTPQEFSAVLSHLTSARYDLLHSKVKDLAAIWRALDAQLEAMRWTDPVRLLGWAAEQGSAHGQTPTMIYGLFDLTEMEARFVRVVADHQACTIYLPYSPAAANRWTQPLLETFQAMRFVTEFLAEPPREPERLLSRIQANLFAGGTGKTAASDGGDESLLLLAVPGRVREVEEITRQLLYSPESSRPNRRVGILSRSSDTYDELLQEDFSRAGIDGYFHTNRSLRQTTAGRACRQLAALLTGDYSRAEVMEFLLTAPVCWPKELANGPRTIPAAEWNQFSLKAGVRQGLTPWMRALGILQRSWLEQLAAADGRDDDEELVQAKQLQSLRQLCRFGVYVAKRIRRIRAATSWQERTERFWELFCAIVEHDGTFSALEAEFRNAAEHDRLGEPLSDDVYLLFVDEALNRPIARTGRFEVHEPTVCTYAQSIGLLFDEVMLPGVVEKDIPRAVAQDPLLLDEERDVLQAVSHGRLRLPRHHREREREAFLFYHAVHAARRRLVISYPTTDTATSREKLPSTYLLRIAEAALGHAVDYHQLGEWITESRQGARIRLNRLHPTDVDQSTAEFAYDLACIGQALAEKSLRPLAGFRAQDEGFARGLTAEHRRFHEAEFSPFDGALSAPVPPTWLRDHFAEVTPDQLETYLACPFKVFVKDVLDAQSAREAPEIPRVSRPQRGALLHKLLAGFYAAEQAAERMPLGTDAPQRLRHFARDYLAGYALRHITGAPLLWKVEQEQLTAWAERVLARDLNQSTEFIPRYFDKSVDYHSGPEAGLAYQGTLDRIDIAADGRLRVMDYTTGKRLSAKAGAAGFRMPAQLVAAESSLQLRTESASCWNVTDDRTGALVELDGNEFRAAQAAFFEKVAAIRGEMQRGHFYPFPEEGKCKSCPVRDACGSGRRTLKWLREIDQTRVFRALIEEAQS
jgi:RecB family exonuclease